ncbi:hypothetical protein [Xenorhabdus ishibashii]|uniref:Uncharacterized protein n=1 Tax=Xenorhabdus ishibashii TaxID=1034471 RepID=A0A2D0K7T5_9GAMM|nr:hypothetical protein [Xenorhabdus ishibashii]PHM59509.1 hypothetical protein Xish_03627 [Xenorhabdus ishibashii]
MNNKKLFFYLNTDNAEQNELFEFISNEKNRTQAVRDSISLTLRLHKLNNSLPTILNALLQNSGNIDDIKAMLDAINKNDSNHYENVAWQKRVVNTLEPNHPWSDWIAITQSEYEKSLKTPDLTTQVRALKGKQLGDKENNIDHVIAIKPNNPVNAQPEKYKVPDNDVVSNAKKIFGKKR